MVIASSETGVRAQREMPPIHDILHGELAQRIDRSVQAIAREQHPGSGLFPASTEGNRDEQHHYGDFWVRDGSIVALHLLNPKLAHVAGADTAQQAQLSGVKALRGMFALFNKPEWEIAFQQRATEVGAHSEIHAQKTPPIHRQLDGEACYWDAQNQPDSFGSFLLSVSSALSQGIAIDSESNGLMSLDQLRTVEHVTEYLLGLDIWNFALTSMWENGVAHTPTPISSVAIVAQGLKEIEPYLPSGYHKRIQRVTESASAYMRGISGPGIGVNPFPFPQEKSQPNHPGNMDLATMVAFSVGAFEEDVESYVREYRPRALKELQDLDFPGPLKRFVGDIYYAGAKDGQEALWFMAIPMDTSLLCRYIQRHPQDAHLYRSEIFQNVVLMEHIRTVTGMYPELFTPLGNGFFEANSNDLLWNHGLLIDALVSVSQTLPFLLV